jgi:diguanylate cyclase (GGDEF)-like protein
MRALLERLVPRTRTLQGRIVIFFAILLIAVQAVVLVLLDAALSRNAQLRIDEELRIGERVFSRVLEQNSRQLFQAAEVLSRDFGFRDAVTTGDLETVHSALINHGARIGSTATAVISPKGKVIADTLPGDLPGKPFAFDALIAAAEHDGRASGTLLRGRSAFHMVVLPVLAPELVAWAIFGFPIDRKLVRELESLTELRISFLARNDDGSWESLASNGVDAWPDRQSAKGALPMRVPFTLQSPEGPLKTVLIPLEERPDSRIAVALQRSIDSALTPFRRIEALFVAITLGGLVLSVIGSVVIARSITRPVSELAELSRRVAEGEYEKGIEISGNDELAELARRFNLMREGIAAREEQILKLAYRDALTELPNRALFYDRLHVAIELARRDGTQTAVLLMDLDRFKTVNDTLGHHTGDQVLQEVARRLGTVVRRSDTIARLGGDEFAVLLSGTSVDEALPVARKILFALEEPVAIAGQAIDARASMGIAGFPVDAEDGDTLMRHADTAMYVAKRGSLGCKVYDPGSDSSSGEGELSLLSELRKAVERDELTLHFQPKIELATGRTASAECLVRWLPPDRAPVAPARFIPFAEETGFIKTITAWVIKSAIQQCGEWRALGMVLPVAVNISVHDLLNPELPDIIQAALDARDVPASSLIMEITESGIMQNPARAIALLRRLHELGVRLSIDDFGTGYSSLAYLKELPVHELKIDRSFIRHVSGDAKDRAIVLSTIELGHNLGLTVVAEGVETRADADLLRDLQCDLAQGYFYATPLPAGQFLAWMNASGTPVPSHSAAT